MSQLVIGDIVAGKYRVERILAEGRSARVLAARHLELDQRVAIKLASVSEAARSLAGERFRSAARSVARLQSSHVCRVLDIGVDREAPFLVMEYLDGRPLAAELAERGRLSWHEAFDCILQVCDVLSEAHAAGVVHGDLKPANLFWAHQPDGSRQIKVLGFGDLRAWTGASSSSTLGVAVTASAAHAPVYMAPEQLLDGTLPNDERTDIWALAVVLYELISGCLPFQGASFPALVSAVLTLPPRPIATLPVDAPAGIDQVLAKALSKRPEHRYGSITELVAALVPLAPADHVTVGANTLSGHTSRVPPAQQTGYGATPHEQHVTRSHGRRYGAPLVLLVLLLGLTLGLLQWRQQSRTRVVQRATATDLSSARDTTPAPAVIITPAASAPAAVLAEPLPLAPVEPQRTRAEPKKRPAAVHVKPSAAPAEPAAPEPQPESELSDFGGRR